MKKWIGTAMLLAITGILIGIAVIPAIAQGGGQADVPNAIGYQGYLTDDQGAPIEAPVDINFAIYTAANSGTMVWSEIHNGVDPDNGLFTVELGSSGTPILANHLTGDRWLGVKVGIDNEMIPRQKLSSVPYALRSDVANRAFSLNAPDGSPEDAVYVDNEGSVMCGPVNIGGKFEVKSYGAGVSDQWIGGSEAHTSAPDNWQSFTAGMSGRLSEVDLSFGSTCGFTVLSIYEGEGIGGSLLYVHESVSTKVLYNTWVFTSDVLITAGNQYTIRVETTGCSTTWGHSLSDIYTGGRASFAADRDFNFITCVQPPESAFLVGSNRKIGIGTSLPSAELEIYRNQENSTNLHINNPELSSGSALYFYQGTKAQAYLSSKNDHHHFGANTLTMQNYGGPIQISTDNGGNYPMFLLPDGGKVGIGTLNPASTLDVNGTVRAAHYRNSFGSDLLYSTDSSIRITEGSYGSWDIMVDDYDSDWIISSPNMYSGIVGNVGIGTTSPNDKLEVYSYQDDWTNIRLNNPDTGSDAGSALYFFQGSGTQSYIASANSGNSSAISGPDSLTMQNYGGPIQIRTAGGGDYPISLLADGGKVGIGTSNPLSTLDVNGILRADNYRDSTGGNLIRSSDASVNVSEDGDGSWNLTASGVGDSDWTVNGIDMYSAVAGNVGIGTTTPGQKLHVSGTALISGDTYINTVTEGRGSIHYGNRGLIGSATTFNPNSDFNGLWIEGSIAGSESGGIFMNGDTMCLWSPGDYDILRVYDEDDFSVPKFVIDSDGDVGIGTTSPNTKLAVDGLTATASYNNVRVNTATGDFYYESSSERFKDNIQDFETDFDTILKVEPKTFVDVSSGQQEIGYIAEDFDELGLTDLVIYDANNNPNGINYELVSLYLLKVVEDQQSDIQALTERIEALGAE